MDSPHSTALNLTNIRKRFGDVAVLHRVSLDIRAGEIHALVGENGAGKSTLMKIAAGIHRPDDGEMTLDGRPYAPATPAEALQCGIAMVHQELSLAPHLSVAENILMGREFSRRWFVRWRQVFDTASRKLAEFGLTIDPATPVSELNAGHRQVVEIVKALAWRPKLLILDEPTSSLESQGAELVLSTLQKLRAQGVAIAYISHRMDELFRIGDRITVLRDGCRVGTWAVEETSPTDVINAMVGRKMTRLYPARAAAIGDPLLEVRHLGRTGAFEDVSFTLHRKEILGFSGLIGAGRSELMRAVFGAEPATCGEIVFEGRPRRLRSVQAAIDAGIAYVPEDRKTQGLFLDRTIEENTLCGNLARCSRRGMVRGRLARSLAENSCRALDIRARGIDQVVQSLSGGNQQKTLLARWLATAPKVLIVDEPTRGIDVGAKADIHQRLREYAEAGNGVIVVSSEMLELIGLCDRILVMHEGRLAGEVPGKEATEEALIHLAVGPVEGTEEHHGDTESTEEGTAEERG